MNKGRAYVKRFKLPKPVKLSKLQLSVTVTSVLIVGLIFWFFVWPFLGQGNVSGDGELFKRTDNAIKDAKELVKNGDVNKAIDILEDAASKTSESDEKAEYYRSQASIVASNGDINKAVAIASKADTTKSLSDQIVDPSDGESYTEFMTATYKIIADLKANIEADYPGLEGYDKLEVLLVDIGNIAYSYSLIGDFSTAIDYYQIALDIYNSNPSLDEYNRSGTVEAKILELENR